ncbi:rhamnosyltransferase [Dysgonomonas alginatilytica]|uniref:Rhamnosyltransferase n=1 Tax=Dysgonomonas alginatilytica TaxID=1605892 RepID=A0A2V3PMP0_9BACT|nr:glycosyltransferase family 2 protein [Dysgonomonas alginatilytica]PXV62186.1 rhamnosyltransferase [Dysgonomonas alginatilytica]
MVGNNVFAIIVTFNPELDLLSKQLESLKHQVNGIVYVDNGTKNIEQLKKFYEEHTFSTNIFYILNLKNQGLGYAQNQGIKLAFEKGADHIFLLDHDSIVEHNCIYQLLETEKSLLKKGIKVGLVGPVFVNVHNNLPSPASIMQGLCIKKRFPKNDPIFASYLIASGSLIRTNVLKTVGLIDEKLFIDGLDLEWCFRANYFGFKIVMTPDAKMEHRLGDRRISIGKVNLASHSPQRRYYIVRNSFLFNRYKHIPLGFRIRTGFLSIIKICAMLIKSTNRKDFYRYNILGLRDGILGKFGEFN